MSKPDYVRWLRARVGHARVILVYASAVIPDGQGRVLLQRRSDFPWWGLPGGVLERGERLGVCLVREAKEETGLDVIPERLVGVYSSPDFDVTYPNGDQVQQFTACFVCQAVSGTPRPDGQEILDLAFFPPDHLPEVPSWYRAMIEDYFAGREETSFRRGGPGKPTFHNYTGWLRRFAGSAPIIVVEAVACVQDDDRRLLLIRRADREGWALPGGTMELGERVDAAMVREVQEETGLQVEPQRVVGIYSGTEFRQTSPSGDQTYVVSALFACRLTGGQPRTQRQEPLEVRFFAPDLLPRLGPQDQMQLAHAMAGRAAAVWR